jgi:FtsP/CotA-like multicopper oxidase with cupredoxin domain
MIQVASDGGLLERALRRSSLTLHPAERVDVLVDFRQFRTGSEIVLQNAAAEQESTRAVMRFDVERGGGSEEARIPRGRMRTLEKLPKPSTSRRWSLSLSTTSGVQWQMASRAFDHSRTDVVTRLGTTELWQWHNPSNRSHPMHLHGMLFRILERSTGVVPPHERGWKDTVGVAAGETVSVQPWFVPYRGRYVFHCHNLEHGDKAMMLQLEVVE